MGATASDRPGVRFRFRVELELGFGFGFGFGLGLGIGTPRRSRVGVQQLLWLRLYVLTCSGILKASGAAKSWGCELR